MIASGPICKRLLDGLVAIEFQVAVDVGRALTESLRDHSYFIGMGNQISHVLLSFRLLRVLSRELLSDLFSVVKFS